MELITTIFDGIAWTVAIVCTAVCTILLANHISDLIKVRIDARHDAASAWQEGYDQGVSDERQAAEWDIPEYRIPHRQNPYGTPGRSGASSLE